MPAVRFLPVSSGSKGNCYYIETPHARLLLDCGVSYKHLAAALRGQGLDPALLDAVVITHTHSDHISGLARLLRQQRLRIFVHERARAQLDLELRRQDLPGGLDSQDCQCFGGDGLPYRDLDLLPVPVSHDCSPTVMFKFFAGGKRLGVLTDLGVYEPAHLALFGDCDVLVLESNHCPDLLRRGPYPARLKARIAGSRGHLSNMQALEFALSLPRLPEHLILGHLSDTNNTPETASDVFAAAVSMTSLPLQPEPVRAGAAPGLFSHWQPVDPGNSLERRTRYAHGRGIPHTVLRQLTPGRVVELAA